MAETEIPTWRKPIDAIISSRSGAAVLRRIAHHLDRPLLRMTRGRFANTFGMPTLLLTTTGRKSGERRGAPLLYFPCGEDLAIIGTHWGSTRHPAWYHNLTAKPEATVLRDGEEFEVVARAAMPEEREQVWAAAARIYGGYAKYRTRVGDREIPIMILSRVESG